MAKTKKEKTTLSAADKVALMCDGYFERYPNTNEFYATESGQFFFKENDARNNALGGKVLTFKRKK